MLMGNYILQITQMKAVIFIYYVQDFKCPQVSLLKKKKYMIDDLNPIDIL